MEESIEYSRLLRNFTEFSIIGSNRFEIVFAIDFIYIMRWRICTSMHMVEIYNESRAQKGDLKPSLRP